MTALLPTIIGMNEATKETRDHEEKRRKNARTQRSHLVATCDYAAGSREQRQAVHNAQIYLGRDGRVSRLVLSFILSFIHSFFLSVLSEDV